jgi:two-component system OmpR family sensor kinase/two-component system sensor histidine kinase BaeS
MDAGHLELRPELTSLRDLISDTLEGSAARAQAQGVRLVGSVGPGLEAVWLAPDKIGRVLHNLVDNALRHTPAGGQIEVQAQAEGAWARVSVRDTGEGIPAEELPRVFDRFYRGDAARSRAVAAPGAGRPSGGAGLGLAIARGLVEAHGGDITAESDPGAGTTLTFRLPLRASRPPGQ